MKDALELHPSRSVARRMYELETELERARIHLRSQSKSPDTTARWGLEMPAPAQQEESWFITYLDMMTLLLVVMIVMLGFSGTLGAEPGWLRQHSPEGTQLASKSTPPAATDTMSIPGGSGPLPGLASLPDALAVSEPLADATLDIITLPFVANAAPGKEADSEAPDPLPATLDALYPGWSAADLAASFVGPPRPTGPAAGAAIGTAITETPATEAGASEVATSEAVANEATADQALATEVAIPDALAAGDSASGASPPSEGATLAAGLSLNELGKDVEVVVNERSVSFRVNSEILFDSSQTDLSRSGLAVLRRIAAVLSDAGHEITVEGHTDSVPVRRNVRFPSNWELSSARAGSVVRYLHANGIAKTRLKAIGYADTRPIADNHTPDGRARNRRVELLIEQNVATRSLPELANRAQNADNEGMYSTN